jgi:hypothetical protein
MKNIEERAEQIIEYVLDNTLYDYEASDKIIKLADEYAIGFAEWLYRYDNTRLPNGNWIIKLGLKPYTSEEVLEIYKKEKGL